MSCQAICHATMTRCHESGRCRDGPGTSVPRSLMGRRGPPQAGAGVNQTLQRTRPAAGVHSSVKDEFVFIGDHTTYTVRD